MRKQIYSDNTKVMEFFFALLFFVVDHQAILGIIVNEGLYRSSLSTILLKCIRLFFLNFKHR